MSDYYIMKAHHLTSSGRKLGLKKICRDEPNCVILAVTRGYSFNKNVDAFIIDHSGSRPNVHPGDQATYTIDTGNGHGASGSIHINQVLVVDNGVITNVDADIVATIPNAYTWVMK